jgi:hypothetical protein
MYCNLIVFATAGGFPSIVMTKLSSPRNSGLFPEQDIIGASTSFAGYCIHLEPNLSRDGCFGFGGDAKW